MRTIYLITNKINGRKYVGQTNNFLKRISEHKRLGKSIISKAIFKYGKDNFTFEEIAVVDEIIADDFERKYIIEHKSLLPIGYNIETGGNACKQISEKQRQAISKAHAGSKTTDETKKKQSISHLGKPRDEQTKIKISKSNMGKKKTDEHRKNISLSKKGKPSNRKGCILSEESKNKMAEVRRKYWENKKVLNA